MLPASQATNHAQSNGGNTLEEEQKEKAALGSG